MWMISIMAEVREGHYSSRPRYGWMNGVKIALVAERWGWRLCDNVWKIGRSVELLKSDVIEIDEATFLVMCYLHLFLYSNGLQPGVWMHGH